MKESKDIAFSFAFVAYKDGSHKETIKIVPGQEKMASNVIFTMMNGQMATMISEYIKKHYPNDYEVISNQVDYLYGVFMKQAEEIMKAAPDRAYVRATEVFGKPSS